MPEKTKREVPASVREFFTKGLAALNKENFDYAPMLLEQALRREPGFFECREALRLTQFKRAEKKDGFLKKVLGKTAASPLIPKGQIALRKDPLEATEIAEQILNDDPNSVAGNKLLAEAATEAGFPKTAVLAWELVYKQMSADKNVVLQFSQALAENGQIARAEELCSNLAATHPQDQDISQALKNMTARRTLAEGGYDKVTAGEGNYRTVLKDEEEATILEQENRESRQKETVDMLIREYESRLPQEPENMKLLRSLAELHSQQKNYDKALEFYELFNKKNLRTDQSIDRAILEIRLKKTDLEIDRLTNAGGGNETEAEHLLEQRNTTELEEMQALANKYPTDLSLRFDLGVLQFNAGRITQAIQSFQKAQNNPHNKIQSLNYLGQCFAQRSMNDLAARTLEKALAEKEVFDQEKMDLHYALGCVFDTMGRKEESIEQFKLIYEVDIEYRDVAAKVDQYYMSLG